MYAEFKRFIEDYFLGKIDFPKVKQDDEVL